MQNKHFEAQRGMKLKTADSDKEILIDNALKEKGTASESTFNVENNILIKNLRIPRKPKWTKEMSKDELNHLQNLAFVEWRKSLAKIEEANYTI